MARIQPLLFLGEAGEDFVGLFEAFLRADVKPQAGHAPGVNRRARIQPLHQPAGLVGIVAVGEGNFAGPNGSTLFEFCGPGLFWRCGYH